MYRSIVRECEITNIRGKRETFPFYGLIVRRENRSSHPYRSSRKIFTTTRKILEDQI